MAEVGYGVLPIEPSFRGIEAKLQSGTASAFTSAGKSGGEKLAAGAKSSIASKAKFILGPLLAAGAALKVKDFLGDSIGEARESQKVGALTAGVIKSTGGAAQVTAKHIGTLSTAISKKAGIDDEAIQSGANMLLCLEESAQALTRHGWASHNELAVGDEILAYDPEDGSARWEPITGFFRYQVQTELIRWKSKQIDVATTPHHRWWTESLNGDAGFMVTSEITRQAHRVRIGGGSPEGFAADETIDNDMVELLGWIATEGFFRGYRDQSRPRSVRRCALCESPARNAAGLARCDACAGQPIQSGRTLPRARVTAETSRAFMVGFSQSETANPHKVAQIRELVARLAAHGHKINETRLTGYYNGSTMIQWAFSGAPARLVRDLLPSKKLTPELLVSLTAKQAGLLLDTLILGDGHTDSHGRSQYIQKDPGQLDMIAMLCAMLGRRTTVLSRGDSIYLNDTDFLRGHATHATPEQYDGVVWCPQIRTQIFLARNNGKTFWTGNTFKNIRNETGKSNKIFDDSTKITTDMAAAMAGGKGGNLDLKASAILVGKALNDPVKGLTALSRVGVTFTAGQTEQIKTMVAGGKTMEAQKLILRELQSEFGGAAAAQSTWGEKASVAWANVKEDVGTALLPLVDDIEKAFVRKGIPAMSKFTGWFQTDGVKELRKFGDFVEDDVIPAGENLVTTLKPLGKSVLPALGTGLSVTRDVLKDVVPLAKGAVDSFNKLPKFAQTALLVGGGAAVLAKKTGILGGASKLLIGGGAGGLGELATMAKPLPVFVTNPGGGVGGGLGGAAGGAGAATTAAEAGGASAVASRLGKFLGGAGLRFAGGATLGVTLSDKKIPPIKQPGLSAGANDYISQPDISGARTRGIKKLDEIAVAATGHTNALGYSIKAFDEKLSKVARSDPDAAFRKIESAASGSGVSLKDMNVLFPQTSRLLGGFTDHVAAGGSAADRLSKELFGIKTPLEGTGVRAKGTGDNTAYMNKMFGMMPTHKHVNIEAPNLANLLGQTKTYKSLLDGLDGRVVKTFLANRQSKVDDQLGRFGGPRANGGPVDPQHIYWVGEHGPEPFVPQSAGRIEPSRPGKSGGVVFNGPINIQADTYEDMMRKIQQRSQAAALDGIR